MHGKDAQREICLKKVGILVWTFQSLERIITSMVEEHDIRTQHTI